MKKYSKDKIGHLVFSYVPKEFGDRKFKEEVRARKKEKKRKKKEAG